MKNLKVGQVLTSLLPLMLMSIILVGCNEAASESPPGQQGGIQEFPPGTFEKAVTVREQPNGKVINFIMEGTPTQQIESSSSWIRINTNGWIPAENLSCDSQGCVVVK